MSSTPAAFEADPSVTGLTDTGSSKTIAAVERAADVLLHFASSEARDLGVTDIATSLGLSKAAVHRLLASLRSRNLITLDERSRRYSLGPAAVTLGLSALERLDVRLMASAELPLLSADTEETATLSVRIGDSRVYVDQVTPQRDVIMQVAIGKSFPLHAGASSKAFLAFLPAAEAEHYLADVLPRIATLTAGQRRGLDRELAEIRERGWSRSSEERQSGAASVAAPILDHQGRPAAVISVCGPSDRFSSEAEACAARLLESTHRLSRQLGHAG